MTLPCLTVQRISTARTHTHDSSGATGLARTRIQFDAWAADYSTAKSISDALRAALHGSQRWGAGRVSWIENEWDEYEPDLEQYVRILDVIIWR